MCGNPLSMFSSSSTPSYTTTAVYESEALPDYTSQDAESSAVRDEEAAKLKAASGSSGTILTSPLGVQQEDGGGLGKTLLGQAGSVKSI